MCNLCNERRVIILNEGYGYSFQLCPNLTEAEKAQLAAEKAKRNAAFRVRLEAAKRKVG